MPAAPRLVATVTLVAVAGAAGVVGASWVAQTLRDPTCEFRAAGQEETMTPEQSANASTMALIAVQRGLAPRAATIAIATSIQESKLRNIAYGDADSLGLFQQRPSQGWGSEDEVLNAVYATNAFYDALLEIEGWEEGVITQVAQSVQRSAYPDAYADHEWQGRVMASVLTGQTTGGLGCSLDESSRSGDATALAAELQAFDVAANANGGSVTVEAGSDSAAWAVAGWAVSHAQAREISSVQLQGQAWHRDEDPMTWLPSDSAPTGSTTVIVAVNP